MILLLLNYGNQLHGPRDLYVILQACKPSIKEERVLRVEANDKSKVERSDGFSRFYSNISSSV